jgi:DNA-binding PadR family transcriptional regulator
MTPRSSPAPESFLPLTAVVFEILLALSGGDLHGYDIMREVETRTAGEVSLHAGTLYRALHRLLRSRLIEEIDEIGERSGSGDAPRLDERRRYYRLTPLGRGVAVAEARRLASQVSAARAKRLINGSAS